MDLYLGLVLFSFTLTAAAVVPFINIFYRQSRFNRPEGGGMLVIGVSTAIFLTIIPITLRLGVRLISLFNFTQEVHVLLLAFLGFGLLGLVDDLTFLKHNKYFITYRWWWMGILAILISAILKMNMGIDIVNIPILGVFSLGWWYVPFAALSILFFIYGFQKADDIDGLPLGGLVISLLVFWFLSQSALDSILTIFIATWLGSLMALLYFNVFPARIKIGRSGKLAFGATLAVIGLILGKPVALLIVGGIFVIEALGGSQYFRKRGWPESKIMMRGWLVSLLLAIFGLWLATL
jgi:phospho-N-acetylmuramoyl-pentapeptide-transferase